MLFDLTQFVPMQYLRKPIVILTLALSMLVGCLNNDTDNSKVVANVYGKKLHLSELEDIFPSNLSKEDSIQILKGYVDRWVRKQLLLNRAEKNLSEAQKDVSSQIEDYRSSLLIFKYEQEYIRQRLDTVVPMNEVENFYNENISNFILNESIVKALFIKVRLDDQYYGKIKELYKSSKEEDIQALDNIAYQVVIKYDYFNDQWVPFSQILKELPEPISNPERFLLRNKSIEMSDQTFAYFVSIQNVVHKGNQSPIEYEVDNIKSIIVNKRKQRLIQKLETNIYNDARNYNHFEIFLD
ncbi:MAG: hypothetical protein PHI03_07410 [Bacteroidales bacterium]|nr:hypothetical protein [Bacteroidales bacterium]MDY0347765.1 hypothetical protein [Tenuifilaceae bacterium]